MEFQTNKETGTQSFNGKYNYAAKLALRYADRAFSSLRGPDEILKGWKYECVVCEDTFTSLRKRNNNEV